jgi:hypothetical protein
MSCSNTTALINRLMASLAVTAALLAVAPSTLRADEPAPVSPAPTDADALRGPTVKESTKPATLVQRDMQGALTRLEVRPEIAALDLLSPPLSPLTTDQKNAVDDLVAKRAALAQQTLYDNMELFLNLQGARQARNTEEARPLLRQMRSVIGPLMDPPLLEQFAKVLPPDHAKEQRRLVEEYTQALAAEPPRGGAPERPVPAPDSPGRSDKPAPKDDAMQPADKADVPASSDAPKRRRPQGGPRRIEFELAVQEMGQTLRGIVTERKEQTEALLKAVNATPEQAGKIEAIIRDRPAGAKPGQPPTAEERAARMHKIMEVLTPEQRRLWTEHMRGKK